MANIDIELEALKALLEKGINIKIGKHSFHVKEPTLGMLDRLTEIQLKMHLDESMLKKDGLRESKVVVNKNAKLIARALAVMILANKWKIRLFGRIFSKWILWKIKPSQLIKISLVLVQISNTGDFINSIRLMSGQRTTAPKADLVEQQD